MNLFIIVALILLSFAVLAVIIFVYLKKKIDKWIAVLLYNILVANKYTLEETSILAILKLEKEQIDIFSMGLAISIVVLFLFRIKIYYKARPADTANQKNIAVNIGRNNTVNQKNIVRKSDSEL